MHKHRLVLCLLLLWPCVGLRVSVPTTDGAQELLSATVSVQQPAPVPVSMLGSASVPLSITARCSPRGLQGLSVFVGWQSVGGRKFILENLKGDRIEQQVHITIPTLPAGSHVIKVWLIPTDQPIDSEAAAYGALHETHVPILVQDTEGIAGMTSACKGFVAPEGSLCTEEGFLSRSEPLLVANHTGQGVSKGGRQCQLVDFLTFLSTDRRKVSDLTPYTCTELNSCAEDQTCSRASTGGYECGADNIFQGTKSWPTDTACGVDSDLIGENCDFDMRTGTSFQPSVASLRRSRRSAACTVDRDRTEILMELASLQNPEDCSRAVAAPFPGYGFAATFHYATLQLGRALRSNLTISFPGRWLYANSECTLGTMECSFQPASQTCPTEIPEGGWQEMVNVAKGIEGAQFAIQDGMYACCNADHHAAVDCYTSVNLYSQQIHDRCGEEDSQYVPTQYQARGRFWYRSMLSGFLFAPHEHISSRVATIMAKIGWPNTVAETDGVLGVHVRRGDACHRPKDTEHNQNCVETSRYVQAIRETASKYGLIKVFVATNGGPSVIKELEDALPDLTFMVQPIADRDKYSCCPEGELDCSGYVECKHMDDRIRSKEAQGNLGEEIMVDLIMLAASDALVGTMTSQVLRLALELSYYWRGYVIPYTSLDIPWCWAGYKKQTFHVKGKTFDYGC